MNAAPPPPTPPYTAEQRSVLAVTVISSFLGPFMGSAVNLAIPIIGSEMQAPAVTLNWIVTAYLVASAAFLLPFGRLADLHGRKHVFVLGVLLQSVVSVGCALSRSIETLVALRLAQGVGAAMVFATGMAILVGVFPSAQRGRVIGLTTAAVYSGLSLGPVAGGILTQYLGWRSIFWLNALFGLAVVVVTLLWIRNEWRGAEDERFDPAGALLYTAGLAALIGGTSTAARLPWAWWLAAAGAVGLLAFVLAELTVSHPLLDLRLFGDLTFAFSNLAALLHYAATFAVTFLLSLYLQSVRGLEPKQAGLLLLVQPVMMALLSPVAGRLSDRVQPRLVASAGMALCLAALVPLTLLGAQTPFARIAGSLVVLGIGFGLFSSPNSNAIMSAVDRGRYGIASATLGTMRVVGQGLSMASVALIFGHHMGQQALGPQATGALLASTRAAFMLCCVLCAVGLAASLARGKVRRSP